MSETAIFFQLVERVCIEPSDIAGFLHDNGAQAVILNENYKRWFPISFFYGLWMDDEARIDEVTEKLKTFYFGDKDIGVETTHELIRVSMTAGIG